MYSSAVVHNNRSSRVLCGVCRQRSREGERDMEGFAWVGSGERTGQAAGGASFGRCANFFEKQASQWGRPAALARRACPPPAETHLPPSDKGKGSHPLSLIANSCGP